MGTCLRNMACRGKALHDRAPVRLFWHYMAAQVDSLAHDAHAFYFFAQLPNGVAKARSRAMAALVDGFGDALAHLVGTRQRVVVVERAADGRSLVGHTKCYSQARTPLVHACHSWR